MCLKDIYSELWQDYYMEILFLLGVLILWYFLSKKITNNRHHSSLNIKEGDWQANYKPKFSVDKELLELLEDDSKSSCTYFDNRLILRSTH